MELKEQLIQAIEAYTEARISRNNILIQFATNNLSELVQTFKIELIPSEEPEKQ